MDLSSHATIRLVQEKAERAPRAINAAELRAPCLEAGAADVGFVGIDRPEVADQRAEVLAALPGARTLIAYVVRMNPSSIRAPARSLANLEFHHAVDEWEERLVAATNTRDFRTRMSEGESASMWQSLSFGGHGGRCHLARAGQGRAQHPVGAGDGAGAGAGIDPPAAPLPAVLPLVKAIE